MIKLFEEFSIDKNRQPFHLSKSDRLFLSKDMVKRVVPTKETIINKYSSMPIVMKSALEDFDNYLNDVKSDKKYKKYKCNEIFLHQSVRYGMYRMNLLLKKVERYDEEYIDYLTGISGDFTMHSKGMIRATRECNLNFIILYYPIVKYIKNFYNRFKKGELFLDIIEKELIRKPELGKYGVPEELYDEYGHLETMNDYNL